MELLVITLAYTTPGRDAEVLARIRLISDTVRNAPGLLTSRFYRSRGEDSYYFMLTTWDDEESWQRAQERHNPKRLLLNTAAEILTASPQQWLMNYLWGYHRPAATPIVAAAHLANIRPDQADFAQKGCIEGLRHHASRPTLAFAFLARGAYERNTPSNVTQGAPDNNSIDPSYRQGPMFLSLFSWGSEEEREDFYADTHYRALQKFLGNLGTIHILPLEPM